MRSRGSPAERSIYFPGLPQIQFYEREQFPWLDALEREAAGPMIGPDTILLPMLNAGLDRILETGIERIAARIASGPSPPTSSPTR